ncbi:MAG TPA: hypothetical protein DCE33_10575, partial [Rhodospirillaceae bacterium]|nr:hypothetical protein [Rhodospirillaceae bacterium]
NASAPITSDAKDAVTAALDVTGNPSSVHAEGRKARSIVEDARHKLARLIGASAENIVFTSGATEANNLALRGSGCRRILVSSVEHPSVLQSSKVVETIDVDCAGCVVPETLERLLAENDGPALVSVMLANNETGVIQPVRELASIAHAHGSLVHCDAVQAPGRIPVDMRELGVDMMTLSAHKIGGPKGVGALVLAPGIDVEGIITGGGQERGRRGGTENISAIAGFGAAAVCADTALGNIEKVRARRDKMERELVSRVPEAIIHGAKASRLANTSSVGVEGALAETQVIALDLAGFAISAGSACSSGKVTPSHVLTAMGLSQEAAASAIRVSIGTETTEDEIALFIDAWSAHIRSRKQQASAA